MIDIDLRGEWVKVRPVSIAIDFSSSGGIYVRRVG